MKTSTTLRKIYDILISCRVFNDDYIVKLEEDDCHICVFADPATCMFCSYFLIKLASLSKRYKFSFYVSYDSSISTPVITIYY